MKRPTLRRTKRFIRNVRAVWQFLKPQVRIYAQKPRFTQLGFQWTRMDKAGTTRRTKNKEQTRRVRLVRKFLNRYMIQYRPYHRVTEEIKHDRYRLIGWSLRRKKKARPQPVEAYYVRGGPWLLRMKSSEDERAAYKSGHPTSTREHAYSLASIRDPNLKAAYEADLWECIDQDFHSMDCGCPICLPDVAVNEAPTVIRTRRTRKKK